MKPLDSLTDDEFDRELRRAVSSLPDAPDTLQRAALDLFPATAKTSLMDAAAQVVKAVQQKLQAVLTFDSWATPALAAGMRSTASSTRYLLYSVKGRDIDLRITPSAAGFEVAGQVLGPDETGQVELRAAAEGAGAQVTSMDDMGEFRLDGVRRGSYVFTLRVGADEIVLPPVEVGDRWV